MTLTNRAVVIGGRDFPRDQYDENSSLSLFDLENETWISRYDITGSIQSRIGHSAAALAEKVYVFGGGIISELDDAETSTRYCNELFELKYENEILSCRKLHRTDSSSEWPTQRAWHACASVCFSFSNDQLKEDALLMIGGRGLDGSFLSDVWCLRANRNTSSGIQSEADDEGLVWTQLTPTGRGPTPIANHNIVTTDQQDKVLVVGGQQSKTKVLSEIYCLDLTRNTWSVLEIHSDCPCASILSSRCFYSAAKIAGHQEKNETAGRSETTILVFGGSHRSKGNADSAAITISVNLDTQVLNLRKDTNFSLITGHSWVSSEDHAKIFVFGGVNCTTDCYEDAVKKIEFLVDGSHVFDRVAEMSPPSAKSSIQYENGDVYVGDIFKERMERHGQGICTYVNGDVYEGQWMSDCRSGHGSIKYSNGDTYVGEWLKDQRHHTGLQEYSQKLNDDSTNPALRLEQSYEGEWVNDRRHGKGVVCFTDGSSLEAYWESGRLVLTEGILHKYNDQVLPDPFQYSGEFENGIPHGQGTSLHHIETYTGRFHCGKRRGQGMSTLSDGTIYKGEWRNSKRNGFGVCQYARTRDRYEGKWVGGVRCGRGVCTYASGAVYNGEWKNDCRHGDGRITYPDGTLLEGRWKEDKFCGDGMFVLN
ncbi:unnamed protein product [Albugo candida]|uniref:MORN repeat-containing protein 3 n=1 Tax=Albugo candida TaxID=65357 RepID=A0A024FZ95_9STRA|nr:unnamed protein product [Albugo candida]|eukprot:CCI39874.1 unnamed protein product [Albugo candida]